MLNWLDSYHHDRKQYVVIDGVKSNTKDLQRGVPLGSVLGPMLYVLYTSPLADIIKRHGMGHHLYADDTQLYFAFKPIPSEQQASLACIKACLGKIDSWMVQNKLKLNQDKTEFLVLNTQQRPQPVIDYIKVKTDRVEPSFSARNIGAIFDQKISLEKHVAYIYKSSFYYLRNITKIRNCLSKSDTEILIHAFIFSKLNSCNSLLYGLP